MTDSAQTPQRRCTCPAKYGSRSVEYFCQKQADRICMKGPSRLDLANELVEYRKRIAALEAENERLRRLENIAYENMANKLRRLADELHPNSALAAEQQVDGLGKHCRIVFFPADNEYPIEHSLRAALASAPEVEAEKRAKWNAELAAANDRLEAENKRLLGQVQSILLSSPNSDKATIMNLRFKMIAAEQRAEGLEKDNKTLTEACKLAVEWLTGWASADPYLAILQKALASAQGNGEPGK